MTKTLGVAQAKAHLSEVLRRVGERGERFVIRRHGRPVAALVPLDDLPPQERLGADDWLGALLDLGSEGRKLGALLDQTRQGRRRRRPRPVSLEEH